MHPWAHKRNVCGEPRHLQLRPPVTDLGGVCAAFAPQAVRCALPLNSAGWHAGCLAPRVNWELPRVGWLICLGLIGCNADVVDRGHAPAPGSARFTTTIHEPARLTSVRSNQLDSRGEPLRVSCVSCHSVRGPRPLPTQAADLKEFHVGLQFKHGDSACGSCHDSQAPHEFLHLADGTRVGMRDAMLLCAQCHGPQKRDYDRGAHGGMSGYWDLSRGPRLRNHCIDCHDPHDPTIPRVTPVLPPRDRFLSPAHSSATPVPHHE